MKNASADVCLFTPTLINTTFLLPRSWLVRNTQYVAYILRPPETVANVTINIRNWNYTILSSKTLQLINVPDGETKDIVTSYGVIYPYLYYIGDLITFYVNDPGSSKECNDVEVGCSLTLSQDLNADQVWCLLNSRFSFFIFKFKR